MSRGICAVEGCGKPEHSRGYCGPHLHKVKRHGDPLAGRVHRQHRDSNTPEHRIWIGMRSRCASPSNPAYKNYGGRGIKVCERWAIYENFLSDMGRRPSPKHTLERRDNDRDYTPDNCTWATRAQQLRNKRNNVFVTLRGTRMIVNDAAALIGIAPSTLRYRIRRGLPLEKSNG